MSIPDFLRPLTEQSNVIAHFIERLPSIPVSTDRQEMLNRLEKPHQEIISSLGLQWKNMRRAQQIHNNHVALVGDIGSNCPISNVDGLICSGSSDAVLGIYVADCAAIWIYDTKTGTKALLHSGKQGSEKNIATKGIGAMEKFYKASPTNMIAVISPCIRPPHYEMDIPATITQQLLDAGIPPKQIYDSNLDTASDLNRFYSYRMEKGNTGRMLAIFGRKPPLC